jgi:hypothetical protein
MRAGEVHSDERCSQRVFDYAIEQRAGQQYGATNLFITKTHDYCKRFPSLMTQRFIATNLCPILQRADKMHSADNVMPRGSRVYQTY